MSVAFIACVEPGKLEAQGKLLFASIRRFAGEYANATLVSFQPRAGPPLATATLDCFAELGVRHVTDQLNVDFEHYPIANKVFASAWAEERLVDDVVVFLDSDTIVTGEPRELELAVGFDVAVRPVNRKNRGSSGPDDKNDAYWRDLYDIVGVEPGRFCETTAEGERIREYWNAGLIVGRRSAGLFAAWKRDFLTLMERGHIPKNGLNNMDQFALAATVTRYAGRVAPLDPRYNYPLPMRRELAEPWCSMPLSELRHVHYFRWFQRPGFVDDLKPPLDEDPVLTWLRPQLPLPPIDHDPGRGKNRAACDEVA